MRHGPKTTTAQDNQAHGSTSSAPAPGAPAGNRPEMRSGQGLVLGRTAIATILEATAVF
jgi:hypothetical protein